MRNSVSGGCLGLLMAVAFHPATAWAELVVAIDMDPDVAGIQGTRAVTPGEAIIIAIVFNLEGQPAGVSSYGVSVQFDNARLRLEGDAAATELLPAGWTFNLSPGVLAESNDIGGGLGQVSTFEAAGFQDGPTAGTFVAGTIRFQVRTPLPAGEAMVTPGLFNAGIDGIFDNLGRALDSTTFVPGRHAATPSVPPTLSIAHTGADLLLSWPAENPAFHLERSSTLVVRAWNAVNTPFTTADGTNSLILPSDETAQFFRLRL